MKDNNNVYPQISKVTIMRNHININARTDFRIANAAMVITTTLAVATSQTKTVPMLLGGILVTGLMGVYTKKAIKNAHDHNHKLTSEYTGDFLDRMNKLNNNKLFIW